MATASSTLVTAASARAALPGTAVSPGVIDTPWWDAVPAEQRQALFDGFAAITPVGRVGRPEDIARAIHMLTANDFVTGVVLEATGGATPATGR
ncbi:SDR family oxidoreductase [Streptomyces sp. NPDC050743]|uniref:SDR family oxidoreductase n=1 Tax=Streptomyces sp. NPDC050743 TaxID=3365634 RepID=UPI0037B00360